MKYIPGVLIDESAVYKYGLFVGAPPAGTNPPCLITLHGNVTVTANVYVGGNLCTQGGVQLTPNVAHTLAVYVKGYVNANGSGTIGTSALPFAQALIIGGCSSSNFVICSNKTNVWADSYAGTFPALQKPSVDAAAIYGQASSWVGKCTGGANFKLDSNGSIDQSLGQQDLFPNKDYTCTVPKTDGSIATMSWNHSTNVFTIIGTIFVDGDIQLASDATWAGDGSLYVNGTINKKSNLNVCGPPKAGFGSYGLRLQHDVGHHECDPHRGDDEREHDSVGPRDDVGSGRRDVRGRTRHRRRHDNRQHHEQHDYRPLGARDGERRTAR